MPKIYICYTTQIINILHIINCIKKWQIARIYSLLVIFGCRFYFEVYMLLLTQLLLFNLEEKQ